MKFVVRRKKLSEFVFDLTGCMKATVYTTTKDGTLRPTYDVRTGYVFYDSRDGRLMSSKELHDAHPTARLLQVLSAQSGKDSPVRLLVHKLKDECWHECGRIRTTQAGLLRILRDGFTTKKE